MEIAEALKSHDTLHPKGETLPDSQRIFRVKVARTFLSAGVLVWRRPPLRKK